MKLLGSILATIVLFLSTQCMIAGTNLAVDEPIKKESSCFKKKACSKPAKPTCSKPVKPTCSKTQEPDEKKGCEDACNPFMACCGCLYDCSVKNDLVINKPFFVSEKSGFKDIYFPLIFTSGVWQPPKLAI